MELTTQQFLSELNRRHIDIRAEGDTLHVSGEVQRLSDALKAFIVERKPTLLLALGPAQERVDVLQAQVPAADTFKALEMICVQALEAYRVQAINQEQCEAVTTACIEQSRTIPPAIPEMLLQEFAHSGDWIRVHSQILHKDVAFAADNADVHAIPEGTIVYRAAELALLNGVTPEQLQSIHRVKKAFDGEVVA